MVNGVDVSGLGIRDSRLIVDEGARILPIFSSPFPWLVIGSEGPSPPPPSSSFILPPSFLPPYPPSSPSSFIRLVVLRHSLPPILLPPSLPPPHSVSSAVVLAWELLEKIFIAAIDTGEADIARFCLAKLAKKFTTSSAFSLSFLPLSPPPPLSFFSPSLFSYRINSPQAVCPLLPPSSLSPPPLLLFRALSFLSSIDGFVSQGLRVKRLYGLMFEANGQTTDATDNYDRLTTEDPTDAVRSTPTIIPSLNFILSSPSLLPRSLLPPPPSLTPLSLFSLPLAQSIVLMWVWYSFL